MAKTKAAKKKAGRENAVVRYLRETRAELRKVNWPTRQQAWNLTKIVLGVTISMAAFLGLSDYLFAEELKGLLASNAIAIGAAVAVIVISVLIALIVRRQARR